MTRRRWMVRAAAAAALLAGLSACTSAAPGPGSGERLAIYGSIMKTIANEVSYVPLFVVDYNVALRSGFAITNKFSIVYNFSQPFELYVTRSTA